MFKKSKLLLLLAFVILLSGYYFFQKESEITPKKSKVGHKKKLESKFKQSNTLIPEQTVDELLSCVSNDNCFIDKGVTVGAYDDKSLRPSFQKLREILNEELINQLDVLKLKKIIVLGEEQIQLIVLKNLVASDNLNYCEFNSIKEQFVGNAIFSFYKINNKFCNEDFNGIDLLDLSIKKNDFKILTQAISLQLIDEKLLNRNRPKICEKFSSIIKKIGNEENLLFEFCLI